MLLRPHASTGPRRLRLDFDIQADQRYRFRVYRPVQVGPGHLLVELDTWLDEDGRLIVEQHLRSQTDRSFDLNCYLFVPGRPRIRQQVFGVGAGQVTHTYALENGRELLGTPLWLRVEELDGGPAWNFRVVASP